MYIDAQLKMAAEAETLCVAEGKRVKEIEESLREDGQHPHDSIYSKHHELVKKMMLHYRLALHAAGLLDERHIIR